MSTQPRTGAQVWVDIALRAVDGDLAAQSTVRSRYRSLDWQVVWPAVLAQRPDAGPILRELRNGAAPAVESEPDVDAEDEVQFRTLIEIDDTPPADLLLGMFEPDGPTLIYSRGGVGKGSTSAWACGRLIDCGLRPMIYDAENRPREWARRTSGLGIDRSRIVYVQPHELPRHIVGRPLWDVVPHLGKIATASGSDILFVDSILAGMNLSEDGLRGDAGAPYKYVAAADALGIPSISIGHTTKNAIEGDPYGSVSWINAMRLTWFGSRAEGEGHRVRWTPRKRNERGQIPGILMAFEYDEVGRLRQVRLEDDERSTRDWITDALALGPRTVDDMAEDMADLDEGSSHAAAVTGAKDRIRQTLGRMRRDGLVHKPKGRGTPWSLGSPEKVSRNGMRDSAENGA